MREVEADEDVRQAERAEMEHRWVDAAVAWERVTQKRPEPNWLVRHGMALRRVGRSEEAQQAFLSALETEPRWAEPLFQLGLILREQGQLGQARDYFERGLAIEERQEIWSILGFVTRELDDLPASERAYMRAIELDADDDEAHYGLGWLLKKHDAARAVRHLTEAVRLDPTLMGVHRELGHALWYAGRYEEAEQAILKAVQSDPSDTWAHAYLGHLLRRRGQLKDAREAFQTAIDLEPSFPSFRIPLAEVCEELGAFDAADRLFREALAKDPNDALTNLKYGLFLKRRRLFQKAVRYLERALHQNPGEERARRALADIRDLQNPDVVLPE
jgi:tetratricopeptide (TPR) repeat protein